MPISVTQRERGLSIKDLIFTSRSLLSAPPILVGLEKGRASCVLDASIASIDSAAE